MGEYTIGTGSGFFLALAVEPGGGLLLAPGFQPRIAALALAAFPIVTGLIFHNAIGDRNQMIHLYKNPAMAGGLLQVAAVGDPSTSNQGETTC